MIDYQAGFLGDIETALYTAQNAVADDGQDLLPASVHADESDPYALDRFSISTRQAGFVSFSMLIALLMLVCAGMSGAGVMLALATGKLAGAAALVCTLLLSIKLALNAASES